MKASYVILFLMGLVLFSCHSSEDPVNKETPIVETNNAIPVSKAFKILPKDESNSDPSLLAFIKALKATVHRKDTTALFAVLDSNIAVSYGGGDYGITAFRNAWNLQQPINSKLWSALERLLSLGGTWEKDEDGPYFCIPYAQSNTAFLSFNSDFDWYSTGVCLSDRVPVYSAPRTNSNIVGQLNYDVVDLDRNDTDRVFTKITTFDKKLSGYVASTQLLCTADPCLIIRKVNSRWCILSFAPFD